MPIAATRSFTRITGNGSRDTLQGDEPLVLSMLVAVGFLRIVTNAGIYTNPTPLETGLAALDAIAAHPNCRIVGTDVDHLSRVSRLCRAVSATGKLVADAQHAAIAMAAGIGWVTRDRDFARFEEHGLRWKLLAPE